MRLALLAALFLASCGHEYRHHAPVAPPPPAQEAPGAHEPNDHLGGPRAK